MCDQAAKTSPSSSPPQSVLTEEKKLSQVITQLEIEELKIPVEFKESLKSIIRNYIQAFSANYDDLGFTTLETHPIDTGDRHHSERSSSDYPSVAKTFVERQLERYEKAGDISPTTPGECPYGSAIFVVKKKKPDTIKQEHAFRLCVDYRRLNQDTVKDAHPLPKIDEILVNKTQSILHRWTY